MSSQVTAKELRRNTQGLLSAPRRIPVAEAVERFMRVPIGAGNSVKWDPMVAPYVVEPMNCLSSREYDAVIFVGPARTGKTIGLIDGWVVYNVVCDPSDMLLIQMTQDKAQEHSKKRLGRTFRCSPDVAKCLSPRRNDNNVFDRTFLNGSYLKLGWPSINVMSSSDFKCVALTDYDRFPEDIDGEGDGFSLASKRTTTFMSAGMTLVESSPGREITDVKWRRTSPHEAPPTTGILSLYNRGDRRRWYWPCPDCGEYFQPGMATMAGYRDDTDPVVASEAAYLLCPHCAAHISADQKRELNKRGVWLIEGQGIDRDGVISGDARRSRIASFWMEGPAAAYQTWSQLVYKLLTAEQEYERTGSEETLKAVINTDWGLPYLPRSSSEQRKSETLMARAEAVIKRTVPSGVRFLVATVDVQGGKKRRFVVQIMGYGSHGERWVVDRYNIRQSLRPGPNGESLPISPDAYLEDWALLRSDVLDKTYPLAENPEIRMPILAMAVDSGGEDGVTGNAYEFWRQCRLDGVHKRVYWGVSARRFASNLAELGNITHINLHIHSPGGDVFDGIAIYNLLDSHPANITVYIDGLAASMASVIAMVGNPIIMPENAFMMIHKPWGISGGDADEMRSYADLLDQIENVLIPAYAKKTGKTTEELSAMLSAETWLSGSECLEHGFADQVTPTVQAMARINSKRTEEFESMPGSLKNLIVPPKASTASGQPAAPTQPTAPQGTAAPTVDEATIRAKANEEQKQRINGIKDLFAMFGGKYQELQAECVEDVVCSLEMAREKLLTHLGKDATPSNKNGAHIHADNGNIIGDGVRAALFARAGYDERQSDNPFNAMTLRELARASLTERGVGVASYNPMQMIGMAFTHSTSDFGNILIDVANKSILLGWDEAPETFEAWTRKGQLSDFKTAHRVGMGGFPSLRQVREGAEYKYVTTNDKQATIALATYGELFSITRQAIINDDLNMLTDVPLKLGRAAKATIADLVYAVLTSNPKMTTDNIPLFDNRHGNVATGAIDVKALDAARQMMRVQKEGDRHLNIRPAFMLVPTCLESTANQVIRSTSVKGADVNAGIINPVKDFAEVIAEPRLDDASSKAWYLAAAKGADTIEVAYLSGMDVPYIDQQEGFTSDGVITKVRIDAGVAPVDHRGLVKSSGE